MRKIALFVVSAVLLTACNNDTAGPADTSTLFDEAAALAYGPGFATDPGSRLLELIHRLPEGLALTAGQREQIRDLIADFFEDTRADREELTDILREARAAAAAGATREEIRAILREATPIRERLQAAEQELRADILAVLTPAQRAWLESQGPRRCANVPPLSEEQRAEISGLIAAFELANRDDLTAIRAALEEARAALQDGATREEVRAILEEVRPAMERVRAAKAALATAIAAVLTPEQRASRCFRIMH